MDLLVYLTLTFCPEVHQGQHWTLEAGQAVVSVNLEACWSTEAQDLGLAFRNLEDSLRPRMVEADDSFLDILVSCAEIQDSQDAFLPDHQAHLVGQDSFVECFVGKRLGTGLQDNLHDSWLLHLLHADQDNQDILAYPDLASDLHDDLRTSRDLDLPSSVDLLQPSCVAVAAVATEPCCQDILPVDQDNLHLGPDLPSYQDILTYLHLEDNQEVHQDWDHILEDTGQVGVLLACSCSHCNLQDLLHLASSAVQGIDDGIGDGSCLQGVVAAAVLVVAVVEAHHLKIFQVNIKNISNLPQSYLPHPSFPYSGHQRRQCCCPFGLNLTQSFRGLQDHRDLRGHPQIGL